MGLFSSSKSSQSTTNNDNRAGAGDNSLVAGGSSTVTVNNAGIEELVPLAETITKFATNSNELAGVAISALGSQRETEITGVSGQLTKALPMMLLVIAGVLFALRGT